jgi:hypothetical protein
MKDNFGVARTVMSHRGKKFTREKKIQAQPKLFTLLKD